MTSRSSRSIGGKGPRGPSGPWNRLKPVNEDPLDSMGLPSRGDTRLLDLKAQEKYYTKIVERYMTFCSSAGERDELLRRFASLDISSSPPTTSAAASTPTPAQAQTHTPNPSVSRTPTSASTSSSTSTPTQTPAPPPPPPAETAHLASVLSALRKLREGIVGSKRADDFATQAYLLSIRLGVLVRHPETYHPAAHHLLRAIHPAHPLTPVELAEAASYLVLDAACRRGDLAEAYALRSRWRLRDAKVDAALRSLTHEDFVAFWRVARRVDGYRARLLEWAEQGVRRHALKCVGKGYLAVELDFLERVTGGRGWEVLKREDGVGWELEEGGKRVVVRRVGRK